LSLHREGVVKEEVALVQIHWSAGSFLELFESPDVINMPVRRDDVPGSQFVMGEAGDNPRNIIARIDNDRLASLVGANDRTVTLEQTNRKCLDNHK
jgi:hypothetical protein